MVLEDEFDPPVVLDEETKKSLDQALSDAFLNEEAGNFDRLLDIYSKGNVSLDYRVNTYIRI